MHFTNFCNAFPVQCRVGIEGLTTTTYLLTYLLETFVLVAPVVGVVLLNENKTEFSGKLTQFIAGDLVYTENEPGTLCCVAVGGYPPADIAVYVGRRDITAQLAHAHSATLTGSRGLRRIEYTAERWTHKMAASAEDDGKEARCVATVAGLPANITLAKIVVNCTFLTTLTYTVTKMRKKRCFVLMADMRCDLTTYLHCQDYAHPFGSLDLDRPLTC